MPSMTLSEAIAAFGADRQAKGIAPGTRRNEMACLRRFMAEVGNLGTRNIRPQHMDAYWVAHQDWSPGTYNRVRSTFATFFEWCRQRGYVAQTIDPMAGVRKQRVPMRQRIIIPQGEFARVIESRTDARQRITFALGLYVFIRISETQSLRWQDVDLDSGLMYVYRPKTQTVDTLPICEELDAELRRWRLTYASMAGQNPLPRWYVVPDMTAPVGLVQPGVKGFSGNAERLVIPEKKAWLGNAVRKGLEDLGYYQPYEGAHTLRRSGATALYDQLASVGHDRAMRTCQAMLGHANIQTTEIYLRLDLDRKATVDLLSGRPMFPGAKQATVIELGGASGTTTG